MLGVECAAATASASGRNFLCRDRRPWAWFVFMMVGSPVRAEPTIAHQAARYSRRRCYATFLRAISSIAELGLHNPGDDGMFRSHFPACSDVEQYPGGLLDAFLDPHQESHCFAAVDNAVVVGEGDVHHRPDLDLVADGDRAPRDLVHAEDAGLRRVEDRRRHQRAVDAAIGDREGAAGEVLDRELPVARLAGEG